MLKFWILYFINSLLFHVILPLHDGIHPLVVDYDDHYYYTTLKDKMIESLSISNCSVGGDVEYSHFPSNGNHDLTVKLIKPPRYVVEKWGPQNIGRASKRIFQHVSENLCKAKKFIDVSKGRYKRAKGCYKVYVTDRSGRRVKRFNDYGATLHPEHVRCSNEVVQSVCNSGHTGMQVIEGSFRELHRFPFIVTAQRAVVGKGGMFGLPCGPFGLFASCEAVKWGVPFANASVQDVQGCRAGPSSCPHRQVKRLFVMTQYDDTQIGQFMQEALPKLIYHLDFLYANPDVLIHYGFSKRDVLPDFVLPHWFFRWLGLEHRLINGTVYAEELYMPREGGCQDIGYNAWEVVTMRERFLQMSGIKETNNFVVKPAPVKKPTVLILTRSPGKYTQNKADYSTRRWPKDKFPLMLQAFAENFPEHEVEVFSDKNDTLMQCPLCQAQAFHRADIVVGMHGAGLSNAMFMRPGGVIVEVAYDYDARHAPIIGIFPRLAGIIGLHHFSVYIRDVGVDVVKLANESAAFSHKARMWAY